MKKYILMMVVGLVSFVIARATDYIEMSHHWHCTIWYIVGVIAGCVNSLIYINDETGITIKDLNSSPNPHSNNLNDKGK